MAEGIAGFFPYRFVRTGLMLAYGVAGLGVAARMALPVTVSARLIAATLLLFCFDLARMALVDLDNWQWVDEWCRGTRGGRHPQLLGFLYCLAITIALELLGLYSSWIWLGAGTAIVMVSQLVFNCFVPLELRPQVMPPLRQWPIAERLAVLVADGLAVGLVLMWMLGGQPLWVAIVLLGMTAIYLGIKYGPMLLK